MAKLRTKKRRKKTAFTERLQHNGVKIYRNLVCNTDDKNRPNKCYFDKSGKGEIKEFATNYSAEHTATRNPGYANMPTCSHDIWRLNRLQRNTPDELKAALGTRGD